MTLDDETGGRERGPAAALQRWRRRPELPITRGMRHELTKGQARAIASLRRRHPGADVAVHRRPWGVVIEARRGDRVVELLKADYYGRCDDGDELAAAA